MSRVCLHCGVSIEGRPEDRNYCSRSCGAHVSKNKRHGLTDTPLHRTWKRIRERCTNPNNRLAENDPNKSAICVVGARRAEAADPLSTRAKFPEYLVRSENHGGRMMLAPMVDWTADDRDAFIRRAGPGLEPLPHRSRECKCINSNKKDLMRFNEDDIAEIEALEAEIGRPMYRPHRHLGATGIREVVKWANSERGKYEPPENNESCNAAWCEA